MISSDVIHIHTSGPTKPARSVAQLARHLGVSFAPNDLQLSVVKLAREIESLQFELQLLRHELRQPLWKRAIDRFKGSSAR
jgi:hypothetical protein